MQNHPVLEENLLIILILKFAVFLSVCPSVFSETINSRVPMSHICLIYVVG